MSPPSGAWWCQLLSISMVPGLSGWSGPCSRVSLWVSCHTLEECAVALWWGYQLLNMTISYSYLDQIGSCGCIYQWEPCYFVILVPHSFPFVIPWLISVMYYYSLHLTPSSIFFPVLSDSSTLLERTLRPNHSQEKWSCRKYVAVKSWRALHSSEYNRSFLQVSWSFQWSRQWNVNRYQFL